MTLRETPIDNSVRYVKNSEQTRGKKPIMIKIKKQKKVNNFNLFQEVVNQTREYKSKIFHEIVKNL